MIQPRAEPDAPAKPARRDIATTAVLGLAVHLLFMAILPERWRDNQASDFSRFYAPVAERLLAGQGLVDVDGSPAVRYPPGYPVILAGLFALARALGLEAATILAVFKAFGAALTTAQIYALARLVARRRAALLAAAAWATYPLHLWLAKQPNVEIPFLILLLAALHLLLLTFIGGARPRPFVALVIGILIGLSALLRPISIALSIPLVVWILLDRPRDRRRIVFCALLVVGQLAAMAPWVLWAHARLDRWIPLSSGGQLSLLDGLTFAVKPSNSGRQLAMPDDVRRLMEKVLEHRQELSSAGQTARFLNDNAGSITLLKLGAIKAARSWYGTYAQWFEGPIALMQLLYLIAAGAGIVVTWRDSRQRRTALLVVLVTGYFWALTIAVLSIVRYLVPAMALLMIFVGGAVDRVWMRIGYPLRLVRE